MTERKWVSFCFPKCLQCTCIAIQLGEAFFLKQLSENIPDRRKKTTRRLNTLNTYTVTLQSARAKDAEVGQGKTWS